MNKHPRNAKPAPIDAAAVICFKGDEVLLIKRGKPPKAGDWSLPGGRVEPGETYAACAMRELWEETGVDAKLISKVATLDADFGTHHYLLHDYLAIWERGEPRAGDDALDARFFKMRDIAALNMWEKTQSVIEGAYAKLRDNDG